MRKVKYRCESSQRVFEARADSIHLSGVWLFHPEENCCAVATHWSCFQSDSQNNEVQLDQFLVIRFHAHFASSVNTGEETTTPKVKN